MIVDVFLGTVVHTVMLRLLRIRIIVAIIRLHIVLLL